MLVDLKAYYNLGTPQYFFDLLSTLNNKTTTEWKMRDIEKLFYNKIIDGRDIFDGCVALALKIEILSIDESEIITINGRLKEHLFSKQQMCDKFVEFLFLAVKEDDNFQNIFSPVNISYDIVYHSVQISNSAFMFQYSNFKQLLLDFEVIKTHPTKELKRYILNSRYKKLFDKTILPEIRKRKIGINELKMSIEKQQLYGEEAERYVLNYETKRLENKSGIDWVAEYSIVEGYDISSFQTIESIENDCFIEVKSYVGNPYFFWTRNEMDTSSIKGECYFLYLVDRNQISDENYKPLIIRNPYKNILQNNNWTKQIEKYRFELKI